MMASLVAKLRASTSALKRMGQVGAPVLLLPAGVALALYGMDHSASPPMDGDGPALASRSAPELERTLQPAAGIGGAVGYDRQIVAQIFGSPQRDESLDPAMVALGHELFHEPRLSATGAVSCASCHILAEGGDDNRARSLGASGQPTARNSPTIYNLAGHVAYFWDGRAASLTEQIDGPVHHPDEMATDWEQIVATLRDDPTYAARFKEVFDGRPTEGRVKEAIVAFELSLVTDDTPFDRYLAGDDAALSERAMQGLGLFMDLGCASCHQGPLVGGNLFQRIGIYEAFLHGEGADAIFKVPSLRNVTETAPYLHDGSVATIEEAIRIMGRHQLGHDMPGDEEAALLAFLQSRTSPSLADGTHALDEADQ